MFSDSAEPITASPLREGLSWLPAIGVVAVPAIVGPAVLWARATFHQLHPNADPSTYLTISRAISDPMVGEPFAVWMTVAVVILWATTHYILWMLIAQHPRRPTIGPTRDRVTRGLCVVMSLAMTASCVGMIVLSRYRLGNDDGGASHHMHMFGSYLFFGAQATTILLAAVYHSLLVPLGRTTSPPAVFPDRWRARVGYAVVVAAVLYGVVFQMKSMDLGPATRWVVSVYVEFETILIMLFLAYLACYAVDVLRFSRARR